MGIKYLWICEYCHWGHVTDGPTPPAAEGCEGNQELIENGTGQAAILGPHFWKGHPAAPGELEGYYGKKS